MKILIQSSPPAKEPFGFTAFPPKGHSLVNPDCIPREHYDHGTCCCIINPLISIKSHDDPTSTTEVALLTTISYIEAHVSCMARHLGNKKFLLCSLWYVQESRGVGVHTHTHPSFDFEEAFCPNSLLLLGVDSKVSSLCRLVKKKKVLKTKDVQQKRF